ncbi:hypothetical protein OG369_09695 [Streptomyces sp. NBC_01221]|uniref:hypothetical protein n=1 Tax=Streptomyces sp. NBC_01221 TaxID=2903782 RepID=UPI002250AE85|nr:hypothetical protein [Streptomyces sp. NBC_01221]MCX4786443.1 hypothetical protein [Streptomyces sp. NBC_01221]
MPENTGATPATTETTVGEQAYQELLDHLAECTACHMDGGQCSEGDRLRQVVRETRR